MDAIDLMMTKATYFMKNVVTGEILGRVSCYTLAAAQEYFDCLHPNLPMSWMLFKEHVT